MSKRTKFDAPEQRLVWPARGNEDVVLARSGLLFVTLPMFLEMRLARDRARFRRFVESCNAALAEIEKRAGGK